MVITGVDLVAPAVVVLDTVFSQSAVWGTSANHPPSLYDRHQAINPKCQILSAVYLVCGQTETAGYLHHNIDISNIYYT